MRKLAFELSVLQKRNTEGSHSTQAARNAILHQASNTLHTLGYRHMGVHSIKSKHVEALVKHWTMRELSSGTIKNRMTHLRWWAEKVNKPGIMSRGNVAYDIPGRRYITNLDKSRTLDQNKMQNIADRHVRYSLKLQEAFGLRREESIKFIADYADRGSTILLKSTWTKGGKEREIPVRNEAQRALLDDIRCFANRSSLIPSNKNYIQQLRTWERNVSDAGFDRLHGLRHAYAQTRYAELTAWPCPIKGGPSRRDMTLEQQEEDREARQTISREMGHERLEIVSVYIGS